jgi:hypothetical protein
MKSRFYLPKYFLFVVLFSLFFGACHSKKNASLPAKKRNKIESKIIDLENKWLGAYKIGDTTILNNLLIEDFILVYETGKILNRHELFNELQKPEYNTNSYQQSTESVIFNVFNQNAAILSGILNREYIERNGQTAIKLRFTETYVKLDNTWRLAICHFSRMEE